MNSWSGSSSNSSSFDLVRSGNPMHPVEKCKHAGKHTAKKKPRKSLTYKAFKSVLAVWTRLELATPCVTGMYSNQLNYQTVSQQ
jgi:hypothetical protein